MLAAVTSANLSKLNYRSGSSSHAMQTSTRKMLFAGNAQEIARLNGDAGTFLSRTRIGAETRNKSTLARSMQNAVSYAQTQEAGMRKLESIYNRMTQLASLAADPFVDEGVRAQLNAEFQSLKQDSFDMRKETFMGNFLYDDMAAKYFPEVDFGKGFTDKSDGAGDSELVVVKFSDISDSPPSGWNQGGAKRYVMEKEVYFNSGKFVLEVNGGGNGERYILKQGANVLFDTAGNDTDTGHSKDMKWATEGTAYTYDFDRFEIEFAPGQDTKFKFVPLQPGNSTDVAGADDEVGTADDPVDTWSSDTRYDNKDTYIDQLGLGSSSENATEEATPWLSGQDYSDTYFSGEQGEIKTYPGTAQTTKLTLQVEADTIFQINATYSPLEEATNNKTIEGGSANDVVLDAVGIGITLIDSSIDTADNARNSLGFLAKEIESVAQQLGTIGANLSELEIATERLSNQVYLSEKGLSRVGEDGLIEESTRFAKENIKSQATTALLSQAFSVSEKVLQVIL